MRKIIRSINALAVRLTQTRRTIAIDSCRHYRGFRYGGFGNNPYEDYIIGLSRDQPVQVLRTAFARAVLGTRPRTMAEALQLSLAPIPVWNYPWMRRRKKTETISEPAQNPDILCYDCDLGILASHLNREFLWLEAAFASIRDEGYKPQVYGYVQCLEFVGKGVSSFLVIDGNHRISAMNAMGHSKVEVMVSPIAKVRRTDVERWHQVKDGTYRTADALAVFDRYFIPGNPALIEASPAKLICDEPPLWRTA